MIQQNYILLSPKKETIGNTEKIVGEWLKTKPRDSVIIATKIAGAASGWFVSTCKTWFDSN